MILESKQSDIFQLKLMVKTHVTGQGRRVKRAVARTRELIGETQKAQNRWRQYFQNIMNNKLAKQQITEKNNWGNVEEEDESIPIKALVITKKERKTEEEMDQCGKKRPGKNERTELERKERQNKLKQIDFSKTDKLTNKSLNSFSAVLRGMLLANFARKSPRWDNNVCKKRRRSSIDVGCAVLDGMINEDVLYLEGPAFDVINEKKDHIVL
ncbi:hypothetical protein ILUMI_21448 [Ignelater luminosus]|uniref:Uncharacterized protein n=1 Tax=Ignelater luminosus TaxID=2038154 RepID=A0A8K0CIR6_IGNLU|nr:hypothetical protein ILUMI_21448 [Ignelater luminosus]